MTETRAQILARHNHEMQLAVDQHEDRMRSLKLRHQLELCQVEGYDGRTEATSTTQDIFSGALKSAWIEIARREDTWLSSEITKRFPGVPFESLTERVTLNVYPDRKALVVDGKEVASLACPKFTTANVAALNQVASTDTPQQPADDGWIEWGGGETPKTHDFLELRFKGGGTGTGFADHFGWSQSGLPRDIIAYRVVKP